jgi:hypothetical protein
MTNKIRVLDSLNPVAFLTLLSGIGFAFLTKIVLNLQEQLELQNAAIVALTLKLDRQTTNMSSLVESAEIAQSSLDISACTLFVLSSLCMVVAVVIVSSLLGDPAAPFIEILTHAHANAEVLGAALEATTLVTHTTITKSFIAQSLDIAVTNGKLDLILSRLVEPAVEVVNNIDVLLQGIL